MEHAHGRFLDLRRREDRTRDRFLSFAGKFAQNAVAPFLRGLQRIARMSREMFAVLLFLSGNDDLIAARQLPDVFEFLVRFSASVHEMIKLSYATFRVSLADCPVPFAMKMISFVRPWLTIFMRDLWA